MTPKKGDQIPLFPQEPAELRLCLGCRTKYEADPDLSGGEGWCPTCGSRTYEIAIPSDYRMTELTPKTEAPKPGSTEDYTNGRSEE